MPTTAGSTLWPDFAGAYTDPISNAPPFGLSHELEYLEVTADEQHPLTTVRLALARAGSPPRLYASEAHARRVGWVMTSLDTITTSVLLMDRVTKETFPAHIPGAGDLRLPHNLLMQCADSPDYVILPGEGPLTNILLFDSWSGLSSCRDYVILGPWCIGCQNVVWTKDNLCDECSAEMDREATLPSGDNPSCTPPDALDNSYQG